MSSVIRYSRFASFLVCLALTGGTASGAEDGDNEIMEPDQTGAAIEPEQTDATSETTNAAYSALQNQEYDVAYDLFYSLASQDNALAQYELGALYHRGAGIDKDALRASRWYERAAQQGYAEAQYRLGNMYLMGEGVRQSDTEAAHWFEKAAQQGHADARSNLTNLKRISTAKTRKELEQEAASLPPLKVKDKTAAKGKTEESGFFTRWFGGDDKTRASPDSPAEDPAGQAVVSEAQAPAKRSNPDIASVKTDDASGSSTSKTKGFFSRLFNRDGKEDEKTPGDVTPAATGGDEPGSAASTGETGARPPAPLGGSSAVSNYELGMAYALGDTLEQDDTKAFEHFTRSAEQGYAPAQYRLGVAYANGDGTGKNLAKAVEWYEKSARQGHATAQRSLARIYLNGEGDIAQNKPLALAWYSLLAEDGNRMDIYRRDALLQELSDAEIRMAQGLTTEIENQSTPTSHQSTQ